MSRPSLKHISSGIQEVHLHLTPSVTPSRKGLIDRIQEPVKTKPTITTAVYLHIFLLASTDIVMNNYIVHYLYMFYVVLLYVYVVTWTLRIVI
jgi:hypothetical protein